MTIKEFHIAIGQEFDKTQDFEYPYMSPEQIDYWINKGIERFVKERAFGNNIRRWSFEEVEKRVDDLRTIVKESGNIASISGGTNKFTVALPLDYQYLVRHRVTTQKTNSCVSSFTVKGVQTRQDWLGDQELNPFESPTYKEPLYYLLGNNIVYETTSDFTILNSNITYISKPNKVRLGTEYVIPTTDVDCNLPEHTHSEIIDLTISLMLENIESSRYQSYNSELSKQE